MKLNILVIDDDILTRREIKQMLSYVGHKMTSVESGVKALQLLKSNHYDLIFLDLKMPSMDGIDVLKVIKMQDVKSYIILITAYATIETAVEALKLGAYDYIRKPFQPKQLQDIVDKVMDEMSFEDGYRSIEQEYTRQDCYKLFLKHLGDYDKGLCISRTKPDDILKKLNKEQKKKLRDSIFWITESKDDSQAIHPLEIEELEEIINDFLKKGGGVLLIDGIKTLLEFNSWETVKSLLDNMTGRINATSSFLIISVDSEDMETNALREIRNILVNSHRDYVFDSLANSIRRDIIKFLSVAKKANFTTILRGVDGGDSPKFTFHLKVLGGNNIIEKDENGLYSLTSTGERLYEIFSRIEEGNSEEAEQRISLVLSSSG